MDYSHILYYDEFVGGFKKMSLSAFAPRLFRRRTAGNEIESLFQRVLEIEKDLPRSLGRVPRTHASAAIAASNAYRAALDFIRLSVDDTARDRLAGNITLFANDDVD